MICDSVALRSTEGSDGLSRGRLCGLPPPQPASPPATHAATNSVSLCRMRFGPGGIGVEHRHADAEVRALVFAVDDLDGAAMRVHELEHDREPDARALDLHAGRRSA